MPLPWANQDLILSIDSAQPAGSQLGGMAGSQGLPPGNTLIATGKSPIFDLAYYKALTLFWVLVSFTGGTTPTFAPELDTLDDALNNVQVFTPDVVPLWTPAAVSAATKWVVGASAHGGLTAPTPTGWTAVAINFPFGNFGQLAWTVTGAPTNVTWHAFLYGKR